MPQYSGHLDKMQTSLDPQGLVHYALVLDDRPVAPLNELVGQEVYLSFGGVIRCTNCAKKIKKTFSDGLCWNCFSKLASADMCILKPHTCHYHLGTCREPQWGLEHCHQDHILYLSLSSGMKVGITRASNMLTRWADQGAVAGLAIGRFPNRLAVGQAEFALSAHIADKTDYRKMLTNQIAPDRLEETALALRQYLSPEQQDHLLASPERRSLSYPHTAWPQKVSSVTLDKTPFIRDTLTAIKGQYLVFGSLAINLRSHAGYQVSVAHD